MQMNSAAEWMRKRRRLAVANNQLILNMLEQRKETGSSVSAAAGFDGVVDAIVRIIKKQDEQGQKYYFQTIDEFGKYLITKKNMSCSLEMELQQEKIGGNMAIFSNCLGTLGMPVECIGSMGEPEIHPLFQDMNSNCSLHSVCKYGQCNALEFFDGKVMLYSMDSLKELTWENICNRLGQEQVAAYFRNSQLVALLNWSELFDATDLFRKIYANSMKDNPDKNKWVFLDLSDASRRTEEEIREVLKLGEEIGTSRTTIFSMNENECQLVYRALFGEECKNRTEMGKRISRRLHIDYLVLHLPDSAYGYVGQTEVREEGYFTSTPKLSTGGGDNFNAGLCFGMLHGLPLQESLKLGNAVSGYYVRNGKSPDIRQLCTFIQEEDRKKRGEHAS